MEICTGIPDRMVNGIYYHIYKIEHPFAGEEYGRARWGDAKEFTRQFANHDEKMK